MPKEGLYSEKSVILNCSSHVSARGEGGEEHCPSLGLRVALSSQPSSIINIIMIVPIMIMAIKVVATATVFSTEKTTTTRN